MRLALRLGRTVRELLATTSSEELTDWRAFDSVEPIGDGRLDLGFGVVAATVANYAGMARKSGSDPASPKDFMPLLPKKTQSQSQQELRTMLMAMVPKKKG